jgi:UDP-glucose 4-epimerase
VTVLDDLSTGDRAAVNPRADFIQGDVRDDAALREAFHSTPAAVCHIAGQASISLAYANPEADLGVNVVGTLKVLEYCLAHRVPRLVYASSMTVYGNPQQVPTPECAPANPLSFYGVTKYTAERYAHLTGARTDLDSPLSVTSLRMFNVFGPRQRLDNPYQGVLAIFLGNVMRDEPITIHGDGGQSRDFVYVTDVVHAWQRALDEPRSTGKVLNIGSGAATSVNQLCDTVLAVFGRSREDYSVLSAPGQQGDIQTSIAEITEAQKVLGWAPKVAFSDGLKEAVAWAMRISRNAT